MQGVTVHRHKVLLRKAINRIHAERLMLYLEQTSCSLLIRWTVSESFSVQLTFTMALLHLIMMHGVHYLRIEYSHHRVVRNLSISEITYVEKNSGLIGEEGERESGRKDCKDVLVGRLHSHNVHSHKLLCKRI